VRGGPSTGSRGTVNIFARRCVTCKLRITGA
jgi:hypothetical protein